MEKGLISWFIGPQLVGVIFIIVGYIQKAYPPKKINALYGYRTPAAMKNQETWDEANRYSAGVMIKTGFILLIGGFLITFLLQTIPMPERFKAAFWYLTFLAAAMGSAITMLVSTEKHLEKTFKNKE